MSGARPRPVEDPGFSLIELAIALLVLTLLAGSGARLTLALARRGEIERTRVELEDGRTALRGFVALYGRLPCPDGDEDGAEDREGPACSRVEGFLPHGTLGVGRHDAWGRRLRYRLAAGLGSVPNVEDEPFIRVCEGDARGDCGRVVAGSVAALILSHGANGHGYDPGGRGPPPLSALHERVNADGGETPARIFVSHEPREAGGEGGVFDDQLTWLPYSVYRATQLDR